MVATFVETTELERPDRKILKAIGMPKAGRYGWPSFRSHLAGHQAWFVTENEAAWLTDALQAAVYLAEKVSQKEIPWPFDPEVVITFRCQGIDKSGRKKIDLSMEPLPIVRPEPDAPIALPAASVARCQRVGRTPMHWEADVFNAPFTLTDRPRPYHPLQLLIADEASGFVFDVQIETPENNRVQLIVDGMLRAIEKHSVRPSVLWVSDAKQVAALAPLAKALEMKIDARKPLRSISNARQAMNAMLKPRPVSKKTCLFASYVGFQEGCERAKVNEANKYVSIA